MQVTQPSLTRAIQKLEEEFGGPLFRRERSRTHLTDLGREILPLFETAYEAAQAAKNLAREIGKAQVAPLTLGIANTIENDDLHVLLGEIGAHLPGFELTLQSGSSEEMIGLGLNGTLDLFCGRSARRRARQVRSLVAVRPCLSCDDAGGASAGEPGCSDARRCSRRGLDRKL
jgi:DNA-binding transcriptional LysR family regulator